MATRSCPRLQRIYTFIHGKKGGEEKEPEVAGNNGSSKFNNNYECSCTICLSPDCLSALSATITYVADTKEHMNMNYIYYIHRVYENLKYEGEAQNMKLTQVLGKLRELVDMFTGVLAVRDAEAELEVEALEQLVAEVVPLDHAELVHRHGAHAELDPARMHQAETRESLLEKQTLN